MNVTFLKELLVFVRVREVTRKSLRYDVFETL